MLPLGITSFRIISTSFESTPFIAWKEDSAFFSWIKKFLSHLTSPLEILPVRRLLHAGPTGGTNGVDGARPEHSERKIEKEVFLTKENIKEVFPMISPGLSSSCAGPRAFKTQLCRSVNPGLAGK